MSLLPIALVLTPSWHIHREAAIGVAEAVAGGLPWELQEHWTDLVTDADLGRCAGVLGRGFPGRPAVGWSRKSAPAPVLVGPDDRALGSLAAQHLMAQGYRRFAYVGHVDHSAATPRKAGFLKYLADHGQTALVHERSQGEPFDRSWLRSLPARTGLFLAYDHIAREIIDHLDRAGRPLGTEIGVLGVDNDPMVVALSGGRLSSIRSPWREVGRHSARLLAELLAGGAVPTTPQVIPASEVVVRSSTQLDQADHTPEGVLAWITLNVHRGIDVRDVVALTGWSRRTVERQIHRLTGRSPREEIRRARVALAQHLLKTPGIDPSSVPQRAGFSSQRGMLTAFREEGVAG